MVVIMGVAGSGKTTVGRLVASAIEVPFLDGDDFHSSANIAAMSHGVPLDDAARRPWGRRLHAELTNHAGTGAVLACSALREAFRRDLRRGLPKLRFVLLCVPDAELRRRLEHRTRHFVGVELLSSQLDSLEVDGDLEAVDGDRAAEVVAAEIAALIRS